MTRTAALALLALVVPLLAACANNQSKSTGAPRTLVTLNRSGGFIGLNDRLVVRTDGSMTYDDLKKKTSATARAPGDDLAKLRDLLKSPDFAAAAATYTTKGGADQITYTINSNDPEKTVTTIDGAPHPEIVRKLLESLDHLRLQAATAPPAAPKP
jgi:hypothetical protein